MEQLQALINNWINIGSLLIGSIGTLALIGAFLYKIVAIEPRSITQARQWIGRIVFGTIGVELAGVLTKALISTIPAGIH